MNSSNQLLYLAERSSELFFIYDLDNKRFRYMNPKCISFFDLKTINVRPKTLLLMIHPDDQKYILAKFQACIDGQNLENVECRVKRGNYVRWLKITSYSSIKDEERLLVGQAEDITGYRNNAEILNNHNIKKNSILNILAHDLAGPIGVINNLCEMLGKETVQLANPKIDRYLSTIERISKSSIKLIHDFLDQEFLESSEVSLLKKRIELYKKIKLVTEELMEMQKELHINFSCEANKKDIYAEIDEDKFMQVISNLLSNALKFTPDGGTIKVYIKEERKDVLISVEDSGIGIPEKFHSTLFEKFGNARRTGLKGQKSTGLGMSIIKTIVEWHNGKIWFETEVNKGTTFYIRIPKF